MNRLLMTLALLLGLVMPASAANPYLDHVKARLAEKGWTATGPSGPEPLIVGGTAAGPHEHRFQVALLYADDPDNHSAFYCGGSVYRDRFIITAAHCSDFVQPQFVRVLAGTQRLDGSGKRYRVQSIKVHPKWNDWTFDYDIAIWTLTESVPGMPRLHIAGSDSAIGTMLKVTGWGALSEFGGFPVQLQKVQVPLAGRADCNDGNSYGGWVTQRMLCAGYTAGGRDSCFGDSGGPLTRPHPEGGPMLTGIVSWGEGCALPNWFGVYTRVSNSEIRNFIAQVTWPWPAD